MPSIARSSNTEDTTCVRCLGKITAYAGRPAGNRYAHHPGQCVTRGEQERDALKLARQTTMFAATCQRIDESTTFGTPVMCEFATTGRQAAAEHFRAEHGAKQLHPGEKPIRLRKSAPAAKFPPLEVAPFKRITWTHRTYREWVAGKGQECTETAMRGQFWSDGPHPHSIWVIPDPVGGRPQQPVTLLLDGQGGAHENWSDARTIRREGNRSAKYSRAA